MNVGIITLVILIACFLIYSVNITYVREYMIIYKSYEATNIYECRYFTKKNEFKNRNYSGKEIQLLEEQLRREDNADRCTILNIIKLRSHVYGVSSKFRLLSNKQIEDMRPHKNKGPRLMK